MKKIITSIAILISLNSYSQYYGKIAPTMFLPKHNGSKVGVLAGFGKQLSRYAKAGIGGGYFKLDGLDNGFGLIGVDLNVTDFSKKKILPIIHTSAYYPIYNNSVTHGTVDYKSTGKFMIQFSGGVSAPIGNHSLFVTAGVSDLLYTTTVKTPITTSKERTVVHMFVISVGILL